MLSQPDTATTTRFDESLSALLATVITAGLLAAAAIASALSTL